MAELLDFDMDPFSAQSRRRRPATGIGGTAIPRTTTQTVPGLQPSIAPGEPPPGTSRPLPPSTPPTDFAGSIGQFAGNFGDIWNLDEKSPKRMIGRVTSHFDPKAGFTDEMLKALNALDIGDFGYRGDDVLEVRNARNNPGWGANPDPVGAWDLNAAFAPGQSGTWQFQDLVNPGPNVSPVSAGVDPSIAAILQMFGFGQPAQPPPAMDQSWLAPLIAALTNGTRVDTPPPSTVPFTPEPGPPGRYQSGEYGYHAAQPTFQGGYAETPMAGDAISRAMQLLALRMPHAMPRGSSPAAPTNSLLAQIQRLSGVA